MIVMSDYSMEYAIKQFNKNGNYNGFVVKHPEHGSPKEVEQLKVAINTLGVIQEIHKANVLLEEIGSEQRIDIEIFHIVLDKVLNRNTKLTEEHRKRFFMETKKLEGLRQTISTLSHANFYFPCEVEYIVLGTDKEEVKTLNNQLVDEDFADIFAYHLAYFNKGIMPYDKFIGSLREWIEMIRKGKEVSEAA